MADPIQPDRSEAKDQLDVTPPVHPEGPIPGERDPSTLTHRDPGAVGGQFSGADIPSPNPEQWLDEGTARERAREGGGK